MGTLFPSSTVVSLHGENGIYLMLCQGAPGSQECLFTLFGPATLRGFVISRGYLSKVNN